ncbi:shikimate kinase I [Gammaproteobacteria bacterium 45_16_T64]|nr:shikimate kinase I [Gammaproteobacteria bacterium 45_16_T64]
MTQQRNLILIGPMGAGKSTIGRQVSSLLHYEFVDSDHEIEDRSGADIPWIFDVEGEEGFRKRESAMIDELTLRTHIVLATGGGAVMREDNRRIIEARGIVVYLKATVEQQLARTARDQNRPLLQTDNPREVLTELMALRDPLYNDIADYVVETDQGGVKDVASRIVSLVSDDL